MSLIYLSNCDMPLMQHFFAQEQEQPPAGRLQFHLAYENCFEVGDSFALLD